MDEMKRLTVIRHAKSSWADQHTGDRYRTLSDRGTRDAPRMFARLQKHLAAPELIVSSDATRAAATAALFVRALESGSATLTLEPALYLASAREILEVVRLQDDRFVHIALVGHNPGFTELVNRLAADLRLDNLPTCGIVSMEFEANSWSDVSAGTGRLLYVDYPKNPQGPVIGAAPSDPAP